MEEYLNKGKEVLKILINNGCEAYMIGEAVSRLIKGLPFEKIDITTNATPEMVKGIFANAKVEDYREGSVKLTYMGYVFIVRTFRLEESFKDNRRPIRLHYSKNLKDELAACDFTIKAIAMSYGGKLTDAYRGYEDIKKKRVRTIGSPRVRFSENPLRILIAIRLASELGFKIERKTLNAMRKRAKLLKKIEPVEMEEELFRIFNGNYFKRALKYLVESKAHKYIKDLRKGLAHLRDSYRRISIDSILACSYVLNKEYSRTWDNLSDDPKRLSRVVEVALKNPKSRNNPYLLLSYGLEICLDSNYINYMLGKSRNRSKKIRKQYSSLPIKSLNEIAFSKNDFKKLTNEGMDYFEEIYQETIELILSNKLVNDYDLIQDFIINKLRMYNIVPMNEDRTRNQTPLVYKEYDDIVYEQAKEEELADNLYEDAYVEESEDEKIQVNDFEYIKRKVLEFEKTLREKDERIKELERQALEYKLDSDVNSIVGQNLEILRDLNYLESGSEKVMVSKELKEIYRGIIKNVDPKFKNLDEKKEGGSNNNESND